MTVSVDTLITRSVNRVGAIHPSLKIYMIELIKKCYKEGIFVQISSGFRSNEEQAKIYGQGRPSYTWNGKKYGSNGNIVSNAQPGTSMHNYGVALDYFLVSDDGKDSLWTVNDKWKRVGAIAEKMGFEWGGRWTKFRDYPHIQFNRGLTIAQLKAGKKPAFPDLLPEKPPVPEKIMWGKTELKAGQKGKITVLKDINVWEDSPHSSGEIDHTRTLKAGGEFRVYDYREEHGGQYYLGAGEWVTKMPTHILYETPSKAMLEKLNSK